MCRSIKQLRQPGNAPSDEEIRAAALQFVRKVSGYRVPSRANQEAFGQAVDEIAVTTKQMLARLQVGPTPSLAGKRTYETQNGG